MHNYFLRKHEYSQSVIYNSKSKLQCWKIYDLMKIIIIMIMIARIIIQYF